LLTREYLFRLPQAILWQEAKHSEEAPVKGVGAAIPVVVTIVEIQRATVANSVLFFLAHDSGDPVFQHHIHGVKEVLPVVMVEGILKMWKGETIVDIEGSAPQADQSADVGATAEGLAKIVS